MRKELREALERFWRWMGERHSDAQAAVRLLEAIERLGGLDAALADDPTDTAPDLAAVVATHGVALEALGQQYRELAGRVRLLESDLHRAEDALMDLAHERSAPAEEGWLVEPVEWMNGNCFGRLGNYILSLKWEADQWILTVRQPEGPRRLDIRDGWSIGVRHNGRVEVVS